MPATNLAQVDLPDLYTRWLQGAGYFACFVRKTNFVSLKHYRDFVLKPVSPHPSRFYKYLLPHLEQLEPDHLVLLDIPAIEGMRLGFLLQNRLCLKPILTYISPLHPAGLVGGDRYVNALIGYGHLLKPVNPQGFVFILDSQRYRSAVSQRLLRIKFNNQYELSADDLPSLEMLRDLGYRRVTLYRMGETKEDVAAYLRYLQENTISVDEYEIKPM